MIDDALISVSGPMRQAVSLADRFAPTHTPILLVGPTGVGKEVLAGRIHTRSGRTGPLIDVNCAALPSELVEGELFGRKKGAYTGAGDDYAGLIAAADGGTLLLDEIGSLPPVAQPKLLRVLETSEVRPLGSVGKRRVTFRVVAATQDDAGDAGGVGAIRTDLLHRLGGLVIRIPALRDRPEDIPALARHFAGLGGFLLGRGAETVLLSHDWPGNVRELRAAVNRATVLAEGPILTPVVLLEGIHLGLQRGRSKEASAGISPLLEACRSSGGDPRRAATMLGVSRATFFRRLQDAGLTFRRAREAHETGVHRDERPHGNSAEAESSEQAV